MQEYFKRKGIQSLDHLLATIRNVNNNEENGTNIIIGIYIIGIFLGILVLTLFFTIRLVFDIKELPGHPTAYLVILGFFIYLFNEHTLYKNNRYLSYFKSFSKIEKRKKRIYEILVCTLLLATPILCLVSCIFLFR